MHVALCLHFVHVTLSSCICVLCVYVYIRMQVHTYACVCMCNVHACVCMHMEPCLHGPQRSGIVGHQTAFLHVINFLILYFSVCM